MVAEIMLKIAHAGAWKEYRIGFDAESGFTVLDALEEIRGRRDPGLLYRHSCHHGSCGTCGALINGREALMCLSSLASLLPGPVCVEPLAGFQPLGDAALHPEALFAALPEGARYLRASELVHGSPPEEGGGYRRFENCIECGLCRSACPVKTGFHGPAALAMAKRDSDERPGRREAALAFAGSPEGAEKCERHLACSRVCPQAVYPAKHIQLLKNALKEGDSP